MTAEHRSSAVSFGMMSVILLLPLLLLLQPSPVTSLGLPLHSSSRPHSSIASSRLPLPKYNNPMRIGSSPSSVDSNTLSILKTQEPSSRHRRRRSPSSSSSSSLSFSLEDVIYNAQSTASSLASSSLSNFYTDNTSSSTGLLSSSFASLFILYFAGLLTSFSPCSLGLLPLTMSYISNAADEREDKAVLLPTIAFASGLACVFCTLGLVSSLVGGVFGGANSGSPSSSSSIWGTFLLASLSSGISIAMGLQLLELIQLPLPSLDFVMGDDKGVLEESGGASVNGVGGRGGGRGGGNVICTDTVCYSDSGIGSSEILFDDEGNIMNLSSTTATISTPTTITTNNDTPSSSKNNNNNKEDNVNSLFRTFLLGGSSALVASPCATPVLTSILAFVATSQDPILGATLLFTYTIGYSTPLLVVAASGGQALVNLQQNNGSGAVVDAKSGNNPSSWMTRVGQWVNPLTASVLIWYGTNGFLEALLGDPSIAGLAPILD